MKDYISVAKIHNLNIYTSRYDNEHVKRYVLNRSNNNIEVEYLSGYIETKELTEETIKELDESLDATFDFYCEKINPKIQETIRWKGSLVGLDLLNATLNLSLQNYFAGFCWLTCAGLYYLQMHKPLKLKRELNLISWINDNKDKVNEVIQEEVESKQEKPEITAKTNNLPTIRYPEELVLYPKDMYYEGLKLNNVDNLDNKTLRYLKRKILRKERRK